MSIPQAPSDVFRLCFSFFPTNCQKAKGIKFYSDMKRRKMKGWDQRMFGISLENCHLIKCQNSFQKNVLLTNTAGLTHESSVNT